jgi:hypothetical protein
MILEFPDQMTTDSAAILQAKQFIQHKNQEAKWPEKSGSKSYWFQKSARIHIKKGHRSVSMQINSMPKIPRTMPTSTLASLLWSTPPKTAKQSLVADLASKDEDDQRSTAPPRHRTHNLKTGCLSERQRPWWLGSILKTLRILR